eukprot:6937283-Heterocapsa_arctica.AAC.1
MERRQPRSQGLPGGHGSSLPASAKAREPGVLLHGSILELEEEGRADRGAPRAALRRCGFGEQLQQARQGHQGDPSASD